MGKCAPLSVVLLPAWLVSSSCTDRDLYPYVEVKPEEVVETTVDVCNTPADPTRGRLKIALVIDESGSNQHRYDMDTDTHLPGTDRLGQRRYGALITFLKAFPDDSRVFFSLIRLGTDATVLEPFTNNRADLIGSVQSRHSRVRDVDVGDTNYIAAMELVSDLVREDVEAAQQASETISSSYVLIWASDGAPIVDEELQDSEVILRKLGGLLPLQQQQPEFVDAIVVNTGYYYSPPADPVAQVLLRKMAELGDGYFFEFARGEEIDFSRFSIPSRVASYALRELWITNAQTVWQDGQLKRDSDGDGLSDEMELMGPSDPERADSDANGVSDLVEYTISGGSSPCRDPDCSDANAEPFTLCRRFEIPGEPPGTYADTDSDLLNDCEEELLESDAKNPDTNHDYVPDFMALRNGIRVNERTHLDQMDSDQDGVSDYQELKNNTPLAYDNSSLGGLKKLTYRQYPLSETAAQHCYHYVITDLVYYSDTDIIRAYVLEAPRLQSQERRLRVAESPIGTGARFGKTDFRGGSESF